MGIQSLLFFLFLSIVHASNDCEILYCDKNGPSIQFPFWKEGRTQPQNCAPPAFNLSCNGQRCPILHIAGSGDFYVSSIYYSMRSITLKDDESCLARRLLSFNLSSTPFMGVQYRDYTFFSCPKGRVISSRPVECASNATSDIFATKDQANSLKFSKCNMIATVPVPVSSYYDFGLPDNLDLTWDVRYCQDCGSTTGGNNKQSDSSSTALALTITIPIVFLLVAIVGCVCMKMRGNRQNSSSIQITELGGLTGRGLDKSTIETYKKITIGESHVEGPNEETCTICLADYVMKDTIRFMPECEHCFHIECIDKWLSMSRKCPICRISLPNRSSC